MKPPQHEQVIEEFLDGQPRAEMWRELREALQGRLRAALADRDSATEGTPDRTLADKRVKELQAQVAALAQEEAVTQFVEDSVRQSLSRPARRGLSADAIGDEDDE